MKMTERLLLLGCLTASSLFLPGLWPVASAQENSLIRVNADDPVETRDEQLETELKSFWTPMRTRGGTCSTSD